MRASAWLVAGCLLALLVLPDCSASLPWDWLAKNVFGGVSKDSDRPEFCGDYDCPEFKTVKNTSDFEIRDYEPSTWLITNVSQLNFPIASTVAYARFYHYLAGGNEDNEEMPMTVPFLSLHQMNRTPSATVEMRNYTFMLYVPEDYQDSPPKPDSDELDLMECDKVTAYVRAFGGMVLDEDSVHKEAKTLADALGKDKEAKDKVNMTNFEFAVYDPPTRLRKRHNEVLFLAKDGKDCKALEKGRA